ncbi:NINE protein [Streptomyces sp. AC563]|uniref:TM2 domain-containing protein n=1 Tax=Streptomyces buecherae TaxID=2763006 RepID=UPI00164DAC42|nr:TM2 domain-containing protein [Streptomyces buecherae]MBC3990636.1 NINE protein [Streptomyces buecherae]
MTHANPYGTPQGGQGGPDPYGGQGGANPYGGQGGANPYGQQGGPGPYAAPSGPNPYATPQGQPGYGYPHSAQGQPSYGYPPLNIAQPVYGGYPQQLGGHVPVPDAPHGYDPYGRPYSDKSRVIAGVLQILFGWVGAGRFYTGHVGMAVAQLVTCGGLLVWGLVDGIVLLASDDKTDARGRLLRA